MIEAQRKLLSIRSELDKIGIPVNPDHVPAGSLEVVNECLDLNYLVWIDQAIVPTSEYTFALNIYKVTPLGLRELKAAEDTHH